MERNPAQPVDWEQAHTTLKRGARLWHWKTSQCHPGELIRENLPERSKQTCVLLWFQVSPISDETRSLVGLLNLPSNVAISCLSPLWAAVISGGRKRSLPTAPAEFLCPMIDQLNMHTDRSTDTKKRDDFTVSEILLQKKKKRRKETRKICSLRTSVNWKIGEKL